MADTIVLGTQFNADDIKFTSPKVNASNGKSVNILNKNTRTGLRLSTPLMLTWGASDYKDEKGVSNGKFEMALQFPSAEYPSEDASKFMENLMAFEEKIKSEAMVYSKEWFGKVHKSDDVINALWTPMLKYPKDKATGEQDKEKAPTLRVKIPMWDGVWKSEIYDDDGKALFPNENTPGMTPVDYLQKGTNVAVVIQCGGLWFANGKFGVTWKLLQAVVQKPRASLQGTCFIKLNSDDKEKLKGSAAAKEEDTEEMSEIVADSDAEEEGGIVEDDEVEEEEDEVEVEEEEEPEPEPEPEPVKKKKVVRKKAA